MLRKNRINNTASIWCLLVACVLMLAASGCSSPDNSLRSERILIKDGNKAFNDGNFEKARQYYEQALDANPLSETAQFNRAVALCRLAAGNDSTLMSQAMSLYNSLGSTAADVSIKEKANYNLGNIAFNNKDYATSIEFYKKVLRSNPANQKARENLRVAQLKLPPPDENQQNQQNQQDQQQPQEQPQDQQQQQPQQPQEQQAGNADQILQSMQNRENQTRRDTEKREVPLGRPVTDKPW